MPLIECIPNVSEGRRADVVASLAGAIRSTAEVRLLDYSSDRSHNRSVFTFAGDGASVERAVLALFEVAIREIDLRTHQGEHPRIGAVDVVPLVPLAGTTLAECVTLATTIATRIAERFLVPVYLYEAAATRPSRRALEDIRRGQFEGLAAKMAQLEWAPDFGPLAPHLTAGATVVGARGPLVAYNINLATDRLDVAAAVARAIRASGGGLSCVKAIGIRLAERGIVQVATNVTNFRVTPLDRVFDAVRDEAARYGVEVVESEIVGLLPADALPPDGVRRLRLTGFSSRRILEQALAAAEEERRPRT